MFEVPRKNGIISSYEELRLEEQLKIRELTKSDDVEMCQKYISESNLRSQKAIDSVKEIAGRYEIPVINGGERRVGHGKYCQLSPSYVSALQFHEEDLSIEQTSVLKSHPEIQEDLIAPTRAITRMDPESLSKVRFEDLSKEIESAKLIPLTRSAEFLAKDSEEIIVGRPLDLCDLAAENIAGKGVAVYLPMEPGLVSSSEQFNVFQLSDNYKLAKFIILLTRIPEGYKRQDGIVREEMLNNRNDNYRKLIEDLGTNTPVFITKNSVGYDSMKDNDFKPFSCEIDLHKMLDDEKPRSFVEAAQAGKYGKMKSLSGANEL